MTDTLFSDWFGMIARQYAQEQVMFLYKVKYLVDLSGEVPRRIRVSVPSFLFGPESILDQAAPLTKNRSFGEFKHRVVTVLLEKMGFVTPPDWNGPTPYQIALANGALKGRVREYSRKVGRLGRWSEYTWLDEMLMPIAQKQEGLQPTATLLLVAARDLLQSLKVDSVRRATTTVFHVDERRVIHAPGKKMGSLFWANPKDDAPLPKPARRGVSCFMDTRASLFVERAGVMPRPWFSLALFTSRVGILLRMELVYNDQLDQAVPALYVWLVCRDTGEIVMAHAETEADLQSVEVVARRYTTSNPTPRALLPGMISLSMDHISMTLPRFTVGAAVAQSVEHVSFSLAMDLFPGLDDTVSDVIKRIRNIARSFTVRYPPDPQSPIESVHSASPAHFGLMISVAASSDPMQEERSMLWATRAERALWKRIHQHLKTPYHFLAFRWVKWLFKYGTNSAYARPLYEQYAHLLDPLLLLRENLAARDVRRSVPVENLAVVAYAHPLHGCFYSRMDARVPRHRYGTPCVLSGQDFLHFLVQPDKNRIHTAETLLITLPPPSLDI